MQRAPLPLFALFAVALASCSAPNETTRADGSEAAVEAPVVEVATTPTPRETVRQDYVQGTDPATEARLAEAVALYEAAEFEQAAERFSTISRDDAAPNPLRADALRHLGRIQVALQQEDAALETMARLLALEPPIIELDPDVEPPPLMQTYYAARVDFDGDYAVRSNRPQTLAIVNFTNSSITERESWDAMQQGFASLMIHAMGPATELKIVERERIRWLLDEHEMQADPSLIDQATAVRAGRLLGAQTVIFGSFIVNRNDLLLSARLVDVETGEILFSEQSRGQANDFSDLVDDLSMQVARTLNVEMASAEVETRSLEAAVAYSEGLALIEQGDYQAAHVKFTEAIGHDPNYSRAQQRLNSLQPLLASR